MDMRRALKDRLANYKIPQELRLLESIPKNAMGKGEFVSFSFFSWSLIGDDYGADEFFFGGSVNKKSLIKEVFGDEA